MISILLCYSNAICFLSFVWFPSSRRLLMSPFQHYRFAQFYPIPYPKSPLLPVLGFPQQISQEFCLHLASFSSHVLSPYLRDYFSFFGLLKISRLFLSFLPQDSKQTELSNVVLPLVSIPYVSEWFLTYYPQGTWWRRVQIIVCFNTYIYTPRSNWFLVFKLKFLL